MKNKSTFLLILALLPLKLFSQEQQLLLRKDVRKQNERNTPTWGPNTKTFWANHYGFGIVVPNNTNDSVAIRENQSSNSLHYGWRYKRKLSELLSIGTDIHWQRYQYRIKQNEQTNLFSPSVKNDRQKLIFNSVALGGYLRINPTKRGNKLGKYIDLGAETHYVFYNRLLTVNKVDPTINNGANKSKVSNSDLQYIRTIQSFAVVRFGWENLAVFGKYRLHSPFQRTGNFYSNQNIPALPAFSFGLEFTFWNVPYSTQD